MAFFRNNNLAAWLIAPAVLAGTTSGYATTYLTVAQAQAAIFPDAILTPVDVTLTPAQCAAIESKSRVPVRSNHLRAWRVTGRPKSGRTGGWFLVDEVIGKHEFITYAIGLAARGAVAGLEILDYRETYGYEIRGEKWRAQFAGKTAAAPLKLNDDIKNISGATLSCRHITDGVKRLLATYALVLAKQ